MTTLLALTISTNHTRYFNDEEKSKIESNEEIMKIVNSNILKLIGRNHRTNLKKINHRNMTDKLTNLDTILTEYRNPDTNEYEEYYEILFEEIKTDADNKVIEKISIT